MLTANLFDPWVHVSEIAIAVHATFTSRERERKRKTSFSHHVRDLGTLRKDSSHISLRPELDIFSSYSFTEGTHVMPHSSDAGICRHRGLRLHKTSHNHDNKMINRNLITCAARLQVQHFPTSMLWLTEHATQPARIKRCLALPED